MTNTEMELIEQIDPLVTQWLENKNNPSERDMIENMIRSRGFIVETHDNGQGKTLSITIPRWLIKLETPKAVS